MSQFRYICLSEFVNNRSDFIWGGALLMRKADIDKDVCDVKTQWLEGGYSDDMLVWGCALSHGRTIATPLRGFFFNQLKADVSFAQAWDFFAQTDLCADDLRRFSNLQEALADDVCIRSLELVSGTGLPCIKLGSGLRFHTAYPVHKDSEPLCNVCLLAAASLHNSCHQAPGS